MLRVCNLYIIELFIVFFLEFFRKRKKIKNKQFNYSYFKIWMKRDTSLTNPAYKMKIYSKCGDYFPWIIHILKFAFIYYLKDKKKMKNEKKIRKRSCFDFFFVWPILYLFFLYLFVWKNKIKPYFVGKLWFFFIFILFLNIHYTKLTLPLKQFLIFRNKKKKLQFSHLYYIK